MNKAYPKYKPSGVEWLGDVPEHWEVVRLRHLFFIKAGGDLKEVFYSEEKTEQFPYPIYTNSIKSDEAYGFSSKAFFRANTITVTGRGEIGYAIYRDHAYDAIIRLLVLSPKNNAPCKYFTYFINSMLYFFGGSTAVSQLSTEQISPYKVFFPPLSEQQAIAAFLDRETGRIDSLIAKKQRLLSLLAEQRTALISRAVTKGLDDKVKLKPSDVEWLGDVPEHWEVKALRYIYRIETGDKDTVDAEDDGEYPFFVRSQTVERINSYTKNCEAVLTAGDGVGVGKVFHYVNGKFDFHQRVYMFSNFKKVTGRFFFLFLKENFWRVALEGGAKSTVDSLRRPMISSFPFVIPTISEQQAIAAFLDRETAKIDALSAKVTTVIDRLKEYRTALISSAVTGKIDLRVKA